MQNLIRNLQESIVIEQQRALSAKVQSLLFKVELTDLLAINQDLRNILSRLDKDVLTDIQLIEIDTAILKINRLI